MYVTLKYGLNYAKDILCSVGILRYLCREKNVQNHWYPEDSKLQAKVDEYLEWQHLDTRLNCSMYFLTKVSLKLQCTGYVCNDRFSYQR